MFVLSLLHFAHTQGFEFKNITSKLETEMQWLLKTKVYMFQFWYLL